MTALKQTGTLLIITAMLLSACGVEENRRAAAGTPDRWWSDNYFAMLQDADMSVNHPAATKPIRMKLP